VSWLVPADPVAAQRVRLVAAYDAVSLARAGVVGCRDVPWVGAAADAYRVAVDGEEGRLTRLRSTLAAMLSESGIPWPATMAEIGAFCRGASGRSLRVGGGGFVAVDPEALADAAGRLERAADALDAAAADLARALWGPWQPGWPVGRLVGILRPADALGPRIWELMDGPLAPRWSAARLRALSGSARATAQLQGDGETGSHRRLRALAATVGHFPALGAVEALPAAVVGTWRAEWTVGRTVLTSDDPAGDLRLDAAEAWSGAMAAGAAEVALQGLAGLLTSGIPPALADPVPVASAGLALLLARGADVTLVPRVDPPQLAPPRGLEGILDAVAKTYDEGQPTGMPGTSTATITVQRLDHADGSRAWLVAIPGTQSWAFDQAVATDMGTNLQLVGGLKDPMTAGVLQAMATAGIPPDEPVVIAGHSQGGMVAMAAAAAAAGTYRIGGVVTAGSPSVPERLPTGVPVIRLEHDEDVVPQTDGEPTAAGGDVTRITRALAGDHPVMVTEAHQISGYVETARLTDADVAAAPGSAPGVSAVTALLGGDGTTAATLQYRVERS
jgi:hypothetical protein